MREDALTRLDRGIDILHALVEFGDMSSQAREGADSALSHFYAAASILRHGTDVSEGTPGRSKA